MNKPNDQELFAALKAMRAKYPDWRFGQLVCNLATWKRGAQPSAVWDIEDHELILTAREHLDNKDAPSQ